MVQLISNHCFNKLYFDIALDMKFIFKNFNFNLLKTDLKFQKKKLILNSKSDWVNCLFCFSTHAKCKIHTCAKFLNLSRGNAVSLQCRHDMAEVKKKWQDLQSPAKKKECERRTIKLRQDLPTRGLWSLGKRKFVYVINVTLFVWSWTSRPASRCRKFRFWMTV